MLFLSCRKYTTTCRYLCLLLNVSYTRIMFNTNLIQKETEGFVWWCTEQNTDHLGNKNSIYWSKNDITCSPQSDYQHIYTFTPGSPMGTQHYRLSTWPHCLSDAQILPWSHVKLTYCTLERVRTFLLTSSLLSGLKHLRAVVHILLLFYTIFRTERRAKSSKEGKYKNLPGGRM